MVASSTRTRKRPTVSFGEAAPGLRAGVYHRVSSEEQVEGFSLDAQNRATRLYCELHGMTIAQEYRDEGRSARSEDLAKRPAFLTMIEDAEASLLDVVVVHKLDRFARNVVVTLETLQRLTCAGVSFVSVSEHIDTQTPPGRMFLTLIAAFAAYYSDNLSWETRKGKQERKAQGLHNGLLPFGVKANADGLAVPDPERYPGLVLAFRLAAEGKTDKEIADALNSAGYRTTGNRGGNPFTKDTVRRIILNRFYLGELPDGEGGWLPGKHHPMLDAELFDAAQATRAENRRSTAAVARSMRTYALSGLARCAHCGGPLHFQTNRNGRARVFCYQKGQSSATRCGFRSTFADGLEAQLAAHLATFRLDDETVAAVLAVFEQATDGRQDIERRRRELNGRLARLTEVYTLGDITREAYQEQRDRLQAELKGLKTTDERASVVQQVAGFLRDLPSAWAAAGPADRNAIARTVFQAVRIADDRVVAVLPQPDFAPFFRLHAAHNDESRPDRDGSSCGGCQASTQPGGSDGDRLCGVEPDAVTWETMPDYRPAFHRPSGHRRYVASRATIAPADWPRVVALVKAKGLRGAAAELGVSHEAVRGIVRRTSTDAAAGADW